jgi:hypothetical protein
VGKDKLLFREKSIKCVLLHSCEEIWIMFVKMPNISSKYKERISELSPYQISRG